jgi:predicted alpha/beta hydrolase family esterase
MPKYFIVPGYSKNTPEHWQSVWANVILNAQTIEQDKWENVQKDDWVGRIQETLKAHDLSQVILIGHSLGVAIILHWAKEYGHKIRGALLVAPTDVDDLPEPIAAYGFNPMPLEKLPFPSIIIASENDVWISLKRAYEYAELWGSEIVNVGKLGHINADSNLGEWEVGQAVLKRL